MSVTIFASMLSIYKVVPAKMRSACVSVEFSTIYIENIHK